MVTCSVQTKSLYHLWLAYLMLMCIELNSQHLLRMQWEPHAYQLHRLIVLHKSTFSFVDASVPCV